MYKLLGNTKFWTVLPEGFLILHLEQGLSPVWLQGKIPIYGNYSVEKYLEHPKSFANLQFFFHRNDHIWFLDTGEIYLNVFLYRQVFSNPVPSSRAVLPVG